MKQKKIKQKNTVEFPFPKFPSTYNHEISTEPSRSDPRDQIAPDQFFHVYVRGDTC